VAHARSDRGVSSHFTSRQMPPSVNNAGFNPTLTRNSLISTATQACETGRYGRTLMSNVAKFRKPISSQPNPRPENAPAVAEALLRTPGRGDEIPRRV